MYTIEATAPGKVILLGEHAVVYGRPAIAVPVAGLRAKAVLQSAPGAPFRIVAPALGRDYMLAEADRDDPLAGIVRLTLLHLGEAAPAGVRLEVGGTLPLGRGLGSGAAISTAVARVMAAYWGRTLPPTELSALVYEVEKLYHGTPSGIDNTVIAFEQPVYFIKGLPVRRLIVKRSLTLVGGDTGRAAPTHEVVGDLRRRWQAAPQHYEGYFDEISALVQNARTIIERGLPGPPALGKLMNDNQEILEALGLSSPELAQLITAARRAGAFGAKLSGAGWGGTMIALAGPETAGTVAQALTAAGAATVFITEVR